jgi:hypothetical protein
VGGAGAVGAHHYPRRLDHGARELFEREVDDLEMV